mgnify:CR=1 FL=1
MIAKNNSITVCKKCVITSMRPGITFDEEGVCFPCRVAEKNKFVDWQARRNELQGIAQWGREHSFGGYDCIIGVSGGKDSTRQALYARDELGLKPLLVSCNYPPQQQSEIGAYNLGNLISLGFDTIFVGPAPETWKLLMKHAFYQYGNWAKATEMALYATLAKAAIAFKIPLIFLGENNALASGDLGGSVNGDANRIKYNNTLSGGNPKELLRDVLKEKDAIWHKFPSDKEMQDANLRIVYLGYYIEDFNTFVNAKIAIEHGLKIRNVKFEDIGALTNYEDLDEDFVHVNQLLKYLKLGFARVTDDACQAIRHGLISREEAVELVKKYDGKCASVYIKGFCDYIGITENEFLRVADLFRNRDIWKKGQNENWELDRPF